MKIDSPRGLYKAPSSAYNAYPFSEGLRGSNEPGGSVSTVGWYFFAVSTEDDLLLGLLPSTSVSFILIVIFIRCVSCRLAVYIARVSR